MVALSGCTGLSEVEKKEQEVIDKFRNQRDEVGTGKFIEDAHELYSDSVIISAIYNYDNAMLCNEFSKSALEDVGSWEDKAKAYASKIPDEYDGEFRGEMDAFIKKLLGSNPEKAKRKVETEEEKFNKLSWKDKKEIFDYINSRYDYYDKVEGGYAGDKYTKKIWEETSRKFGIPSRYVDEIWSDTSFY